MSTDRNPYEVLTKRFADRRAHVLIYDATRGDDVPIFVGIWCGDNPDRGAESIGPMIRQGLAGFTLSATWEDLAGQLEGAGFSRTNVGAHDALSDAADVVRIVFWADGLISCQWLTHGPDESAFSADKPVGVLPGPRRDDN